MLGEVLERDGPAALDPARVRRRARRRPGASTERLAGAVDADEPDPVARAEPPGGVREQLPLAAGEVDVLEVDDVLAEPLGGEALQLQPVARRRHVLDQRVGGVDAELRLRGPRRRRRGAARPAPCAPGSAGAAPRPRPAAAARPWPARTRRTRPRRRRPRRRGTSQVALADRVEEPAVVGDHDQRGRYAATRCSASQATASTSRWLVGSSRTTRSWSPSSSRGQRAAPPLAAGEPVRRPGRGRPRRAAPRRPRGCAESAAHSWSARPPSTDLAHGVGVVELVALVRGSRCAARGCGRPGRRRAPRSPAIRSQQRGLAVAVAADDADPLARADAEADVGRAAGGRRRTW